MQRNDLQCLSFRVFTVFYLVKNAKLNMWNFLKGRRRPEPKINASFIFPDYKIMHALYRKTKE